MKEPFITLFWWDDVLFIRLNWWDAEGRYSTKTFIDDQSLYLYAAQRGIMWTGY